MCRQTNFISSVAASGKPVNLKKGQFLSPGEMINVVDKAVRAARDAGVEEDNFMVCERGTSFGYNNLVSDMRSLEIMRRTNCPVIFDATHSVQLPGGRGHHRVGRGSLYPFLLGQRLLLVSQVFLWRHTLILTKLSDGPNAIPLAMVENLSRGTL